MRKIPPAPAPAPAPEWWAARHPERADEELQLFHERENREKSFGHKANGTVETHAHASVTRQGAIIRLYKSGAITIHQWGASLEIAAAHQRIAADAQLPTSWSIERVDGSRDPERRFFESLGAVRLELTYSQWRRALPRPGPVLAMIVEDCGLVATARRYSMHERSARALLREALDAWIAIQRTVRDDVGEEQLEAARAAIP